MENINLQPGDVVRIIDLVVGKSGGAESFLTSAFGELFPLSLEAVKSDPSDKIQGEIMTNFWLPKSLIAEVIYRSETPEQRADRVENELNNTLIRLNAKEAELDEYRTRKEETIRQLFNANQELTFRLQALETSVVQFQEIDRERERSKLTIGDIVRRQAEIKSASEAPWYPPQQEGYGPWIEGPLPLDLKVEFHVLMETEREIKCFNSTSQINPKVWQKDVVAYCIALEGK
jgi:hypothetical protein